MNRAAAVAVAAAVLFSGCATSGVGLDDEEPTVTLFPDSDTTDEAVADESLASDGADEVEVIRHPVPEPRLELGIVFRNNVALPLVGVDDTGWTATLPCGGELVAASPAPQTFVVMADPGGDAGRDGASVAVAEIIAEALAAELEGVGVSSSLTRRSKADVDVSDRLAAVDASGARVLVSVVVGDEPHEGFEVVHTAGDMGSHRLAGLVFEAAAEELDDLDLGGEGDVTGVVNQRGSDYYAALRAEDLVAIVVRIPARTAELDLADAVGVRVGRAMASGVYDFLTSDLAARVGAPTETVRQAPIATPGAECIDPTEAD